jgi:dCTP deaminase
MGVLGAGELTRRLHTGDLVVSPLLSRSQIGAASIDLRMGNVLLMIRARGLSHVDPAALKKASNSASPHDLEIHSRQKHERFEIPFKTKFLLHPGSLALVPTLEWLRLPSDLHGTVTARSTWAREGLSIATATFIEPRYHGIVTLELSNLGEIPIALYPGLRIAQIAFMTVEGDSRRSAAAQFEMSFEPKQGKIAKGDDLPFRPDPSD